MEKRNKNKKSGFTLIELVVVIAIIGVLAAVITPRVRLSLAKAKDAKAIATLDALRTASNVYYAETGTTIGVSGTVITSAATTGIVTQLVAKGYLDNTATKRIATDGKIAVGSVKTATGCDPKVITAGDITFVMDTDGVGVIVDATNGAKADTGCELWSDK